MNENVIKDYNKRRKIERSDKKEFEELSLRSELIEIGKKGLY